MKWEQGKTQRGQWRTKSESMTEKQTQRQKRIDRRSNAESAMANGRLMKMKRKRFKEEGSDLGTKGSTNYM